MNIHQDAVAENPDLDARIAAADAAQYEARRAYALLLEERLRASLRAVFPDGGTLHAGVDYDNGGGSATISDITDPGGDSYAADGDEFDAEEVMGGTAREEILTDLRSLHWNGEDIGSIRWKYGTADIEF